MKPVIALRHVPREPMGALERVLQEAQLAFRYVDLFAEVPDRLPLADASALVVLGGPMNVDQVEAYPFLGPEIGWIREALDREMPVLGLCLGAQLMAKALGARVFPNGVKEIGWYQVELLPASGGDALLTGCGPMETVFQWHGDTFDLPPTAVHLAQSPRCAHQAFRWGSHAYAFQFHLEMTRGLIEDWLEHGSDELASLDYIDTAAIRAAVDRELPKLEALNRRVFGRFAQIVRQHA